MRQNRSTKYILLIAMLLFYGLVFFSITPVQAQEATIELLNPISGDNKFNFNATAYPINTTFTAEFHVENVTAMVTWQTYFKWNNTIIHFQKGWIPDDNVFAEAIDNGAALIAPPPSFDLEAGNMGTLKYGASIMPLSPTDVPNTGLLCKINFTIAAEPQDDQIYTNIELIGKAPGSTSLDTFVIVKPPDSSIKIIPVNSQPAIVKISKEEIELIQELAITLLYAQPATVEVGDTTKIMMTLINQGNDLETANVTVKYDETVLTQFMQSLGSNQNLIREYIWNTTNVSPGNYTISVAIQTLPKETNTTNNNAETIVIVNEKLAGLGYLRWLIFLWLYTPLGILVAAYTLGFIALIVILRMRRKSNNQN